jgi:hypothetical protein
MKYQKKPKLFYIHRAIEENDNPYCEYKHDQVVKITVAYYCGNPFSPGDCWIAEYLDSNNRCIFDEEYDTLEEFYKWNDCFSKDIFKITLEEGIA